MKKPQRKSKKTRNRNKNSMLERQEYALGSVVKKGLSLLGANLDDVTTRGVRRRATDEDIASDIKQLEMYERRKKGREEFLANPNKELSYESKKRIGKTPEGALVEKEFWKDQTIREDGTRMSFDERNQLLKQIADKQDPVVRPFRGGRRDASENTGEIFSVMGDEAVSTFAKREFFKGQGYLAALAASYMAGKLGAEKVMSIIAGDSNKAKADLDKEVQAAVKEGSAFEKAFRDAFEAGVPTFMFEGQEYRTALETDNPDIEFVPQERVQNNEGGLTGNQKKLDADGSGDINAEDFKILRAKKQEGGEMAMPPEMMGNITPEAMPEAVPEDTYPNATPEEIAAADQRPDAEMEENYMEFILDESLNEKEQMYLMNTLEEDPQLSMIFDKVVETASEFSGSGEVQGPGDGLSDSIPARLSDGEFVFTRKATDQLGADNLQTMMDDAERAYDGGMMRQQRQLGGLMADEEANTTMTGGLDQDLMKAMSLKANKAPSLS
tara:strand:- start:39 stop:1529 length:1491 start_codon:yes stop_codon:yes gene_type:complete